MWIQSFQLEIRKHRRSFIATACALLAGIFGTVCIGVLLNTWDWLIGVSGGVAMLVVCIPFLAVLFGSMTATSLRREPEQPAEEPLPVDPLVRVGGAFLAGLFFFLCLAVALPFLFAFPDVFNYAYQSPLMQLIFGPLFWWLVFGVLHLFALSFVLGYWLKQPILGSGLALLALALEVYFPYKYLLSLHQMFWDSMPVTVMPYSFSYASFAFCSAVGLGCTCGAIVLLARKLEIGRRLRLGFVFAIILILIVPLIATTCNLYYHATHPPYDTNE